MASLPTPPPRVRLSAADTRRMTLRAQGFLGSEGRRGGVAAMLRRVGAVQLDTISVLARSHELVAYARLGAVRREAIQRAYWHPRTPSAFEYWSHAACVLPIEEWPYYAFRRRALRARGHRWHTGRDRDRACAQVLARLRAEGPLTATQLGGAKGGGAWWDWSETKIAVEWLLDVGEVVCVRREGWRRVYDLAERAIPPELLGHEPADPECLAHLAGVAARALGVATRADLIDYHRLRDLTDGKASYADGVDAAAEAAGLVPVVIEGEPGGGNGTARGARGTARGAGRTAGGGGAARDARAGAVPAWADPAALARLSAGTRGRHRVTLLSPFDSLVWDRKRTRRMFGFEHALEAYLPAAKRVHGYYAMPLLAGGTLAGRADPVRRGRTLVARQVSLDGPGAVPAMAGALREAAGWVGCTAVEVGRVAPHELAGPLRAALR